jgi:hypothetical protein
VKRIAFALCALFILFGLAAISHGQNIASPGRHKIQVNDQALAARIAAAGGRLIADYGGYKLYDAAWPVADLPDGKAEMRDEYNSIFLNAAHLDTSKPEVQAMRKKSGSFAGRRLHLVHFAGPVQQGWRKELLDAGVEIVSYIPQNAYLVYGDCDSIGRVQARAAVAPHIQWEGPYLDDYKIQPGARAANVGDHFAVQLVQDAAANPETLKLINQLKLGPVERLHRVLHYVDIVAHIPPANLVQIAARPDVVAIQRYGTPKKVCERQDQIVAGNLSGNVPSGPGYLAWLQSKGFSQDQFDASGFVVDIADSGIDNGTTSPNHFGLHAGGQSGNASRVVYNRLEGTANPGSTLKGCDGHGTINTHIVCGYDNSTGFPFADNAGYHYGLGVCPFARVGSSVIFDPYNSTDPIYSDLTSRAYADGARISNNSWGDDGPDGAYTLDAQEYDALVRDAQPDGSPDAAPGNQELTIVFAAGNDGAAAQSVSPPGTAKNVFTVGGAENVQSFGGADDGADLGGNTDAQADNANAMLDFSGCGPCDDGRQKPDIVAPATHVSGGVIQAANPGPDGTADSCFADQSSSVIAVDGGPDGSYFFPIHQQFYTASSGTSHSTPCVSGGCALVRQYFINNGWPAPSPAMTKSYLMNSARYMTGAGANDTLWSPSQGMGEMNLGMAFDGAPRIVRDEASGDLFTASGQSRVFTGVVADSARPFRVTVAWTDAPGSTTGAAYNNDLDLTVTVGGNIYKGNVFSGPYSTTGGAADPANNVESVFLPAGASGAFTVTINATSINSTGVPNAAGEINQDFALVIYNAGAVPTLAAAGAALIHETCAPTNGVIDPDETVTVDFAVQNIGAASTTNLVATLLFGNGIAFPSPARNIGALPSGATGSTAFSFEADGTCGEFIAATLQLQDGTANLGTVSYYFQLGRMVTVTNFAENFDAVSPPTPPDGWTSVDLKGGSGWTTVSGVSDTPPNSVFCPDLDYPDELTLVSPVITLPNSPSQLSFRQNFNLEDAFVGGVLEIKIGNGAFQDIVAAGGVFLAGGYVEQLQAGSDPPGGQNPLANRNAWSGTSDGFMTTLVNLPSAAQGQNIQLEWICGTDKGNEPSGSDAEGWWIDSIVISQTNFACCSSAATIAPTIVFPTNGYASAALQIGGTAPAGASVVVYDNGATALTTTADAAGIYGASLTLPPGTNVLSVAANGVSNLEGIVTVIVLPPTPTLRVAAQSGTQVLVTGEGDAGAIISVYESEPDNLFLTNLVVDGAGDYSGSVALAPGTYALSASQTEGGLTSGQSASSSVTIVVIAPPAITFPPDGFSTNSASVKITGTGIPRATATLYDGTNSPGTTSVSGSGVFSLTVNLSNGTHSLTATETSGGIASSPSPAITMTMNLAPTILVEPQNQTGFLKDTVTFTSVARGAAPLRFFWEKNGVKIPGAASSNLTLVNLASGSAASYQVIATNAYGSAASAVVVLSLATNPFANLAGTYYGLFSETQPRFQSSGFLMLTLGALGDFSARILNAGASYGFSGVFPIDGGVPATVSRGAGLPPLIVALNLDVSNGTEQITGTVSNSTWAAAAALQADRATYGATNPFPKQGRYTVLLGGASDGSASPGGDGYGTFNIMSSGLVSFVGVLPDNTSIAPSAVSISKHGQWPLYIALCGKLGALFGWIDFTNGNFAGDATWLRVGADGTLYKSGFTNSLSISSSPFVPGTTRVPVLDVTNLTVTLSGGGLPEAFSNNVTLYNSGKLTANGPGMPDLTLSVSPATGKVSGSFVDPVTGRAAVIKGVVLQQQTDAGGFFITTNATGTFVLTPQP